MPVSFRIIPNNLLVPGQFQEIDMSLAGGGADTKRALLIGQKLATGEADEGKDYLIHSEGDAKRLFGENSDITLMLLAWMREYRMVELHAIALEDKAAGVAATKKITISLDSGGHKAGNLPLYIDGILAPVGIAATDALGAVRANVIGAINSVPDLQFEAKAGSGDGDVILESVHKGETGNSVDLRLSLYSESVPSGVTVAFASDVAGSGNPDVQKAIDGMKEIRYHHIASAINDAANMTKLEGELKRRYTALVQLGARLFIARSGSLNEVITYADTDRNSPHVSLLFRGKNPESERVWAARAGAVISRRLDNDPSSNISGDSLKLKVTDIIDFASRQRLLEKGVSTYKVSGSGEALLERQVTMYNEGVDGGRDTAYLDIQIPETVDAIREHINRTCAKVYAGYKLAKTSESFGAGAKVMTPTLFRSFLLSLYQQDFIGKYQWCQDLESYKGSLIVEASIHNNKTRIDYRHRPTLIGQFLISAGVLQAQ